MIVEFEIRVGRGPASTDDKPADPFVRDLGSVIKKEQAIFDEMKPPQELKPIRFSSISFPLSRRSPSISTPSIAEAEALAREKGRKILEKLPDDELGEMIVLPAIAGKRSESEIDARITVLESISDLGGHRALLNKVASGRGRVERHVEELLNIAAECCAESPERDVSKISEWVAKNIFRPRGIPIPEDADAEKRQIAVVGNTSMFLHTSLAASLLKTGDVCFVPEASFGPFFTIAPMGGARTEVIPTGHTNYHLTADSLRRSIANLNSSERPRLLLLINPTNPAGYCFTERELCEIGAVCIANNIVFLVDELFTGFEIPGGNHKNVHAAALKARIGGIEYPLHEHIVTTWGNSKMFGIGDNQLGFATSGNPQLIAGIKEAAEGLSRLPSIRDTAVNLSLMRDGAPYLARIADPLRDGHRELVNFVGHANAEIGAEIFRLMVTPQSGFFTGFGVMSRAAASVGIESALQLAEYFWRALGIRITCAASMQVRAADYVYCRMNFVDVDPVARVEAFNRITQWGKQLWSGKAPRIKFES